MANVSSPPALTVTTSRVVHTTRLVVLDEQAIERVILAHYGLPAGTEFVWDISSQGLLRHVTVHHTAEEPQS